MEPPLASEAIGIEPHTTPEGLEGSKVIKVMGVMGRLFWPPERIVSLNWRAEGAMEKVAIAFGICNTVPGVIAAGGSVSCCIESHVLHMRRDNMASDLDLHIRANSAEEGYIITHKLLGLLKPSGDATLTKYALSFEVRRDTLDKYVWASHLLKPYNYDQQRATPYMDGANSVMPDSMHRVQILSRLVPDTGDLCRDLGMVLSDYDLAMCSFATDGEHVYGTEAAMRCMFGTRVASVHWSRVTSPARLVKYHARLFDFDIVGPDNASLTIDAASVGARCIARKLQEQVDRDDRKPGDGAAQYDDAQAKDGDSHERGYDSCAFIYDNRRECSLDASLQKFMDGDTTAACLMQMVHGDGAADVEQMMRTGRYSTTYLSDWKYRAMNAFCDKFLSQTPPPAQDAIDAAYTDFVDKIDCFERLVLQELHVTPLFGNGHACISDRNTDFEAFRRMWCEPTGPEGGLPVRPNKRMMAAGSPLLEPPKKYSHADGGAALVDGGAAHVNGGAAASQTAAFEAAAVELWRVLVPNLRTNYPGGTMPKFSLERRYKIPDSNVTFFFPYMHDAADGTDLHKRLELITPELNIPCGVMCWNQGPNMPSTTTVLCDLGYKWESNEDLADFHHYMCGI